MEEEEGDFSCSLENEWESLLELVWLKASKLLLEDSEILRVFGGLECLMNSFICIFKLFVGGGGGVFFRCVSGLCRDFLEDFFGLCRLIFGLLLELDGLTEEAMSVLLEAPSVASFSSFLSAA